MHKPKYFQKTAMLSRRFWPHIADKIFFYREAKFLPKEEPLKDIIMSKMILN